MSGSQPTWTTSSFCAVGACVSVAHTGDTVMVRHSAHPDGATLTFSREEWVAFLAGVRAGEFDVTPADPHDGYTCAEMEARCEDLESQVNDASMALSRAGHDVDIRHLGRSVRAALTGIPRARQDEPRVCTCTPTMRAEQRHCEGCIAEDVEWSSHGAVCCDELNPDTGYRCRRTPIHDAGKSIRKHVQIDKLGQVDWWITPARALPSGGEQT